MNTLINDLANLGNITNELMYFRQYSLADIKQNTVNLWAMRYGVLQCIQISINIMCFIISKNNLGAPAGFRECINILADKNYISPDIAEFLQKALELRDRILFSYTDENDMAIYELLLQSEYFVKFSEKISML